MMNPKSGIKRKATWVLLHSSFFRLPFSHPFRWHFWSSSITREGKKLYKQIGCFNAPSKLEMVFTKKLITHFSTTSYWLVNIVSLESLPVLEGNFWGYEKVFTEFCKILHLFSVWFTWRLQDLLGLFIKNSAKLSKIVF